MDQENEVVMVETVQSAPDALAPITEEQYQERLRLAQEAVQKEQDALDERIQQEKKKKRKKKKLVVASILVIVLAGLVCLGIFVGVPGYQYLQAKDALEAGDYDTAYQGFRELGNFFDSADQACEARYRQAKLLLEDKQYEEARQLFLSIESYSDAVDMAKECYYQWGVELLAAKNYLGAAETFESVSDYSDSADMVKECYYQRGKERLSNGYYYTAVQAFTLADDHKDAKDLRSSTLYSWAEALTYRKSYDEDLMLDVLEFSDYDVVVGAMVHTLTLIDDHRDIGCYSVISVMRSVPGTHSQKQGAELVADLLEPIVDYMNSYDKDLIRKNKKVLMGGWNVFPFVENFVTSDYVIRVYLEGEWQTSDGYYSFEFYETEDGGSGCTYDLPHPTQPSKVKYYDIVDQVFIWEDKNGDMVKEVFRFDFIDANTVNVYCYKNERTYTLYRYNY